jgi:hypothetical protein
MYTKEKLLKMLSSKKASVRYEACEWIRISQESSPEIVSALENATHDPDKEVASRAKLALQADVHHHMAIEMGMLEPDGELIEEKIIPISPQESIELKKNQHQFKPGTYALLAALIVLISGCFCWSPLVNLLLPAPICMGGYDSSYSQDVLVLVMLDSIALAISVPFALILANVSGTIFSDLNQKNVAISKRRAFIIGGLIGFIFCIFIPVLVNRFACYL